MEGYNLFKGWTLHLSVETLRLSRELSNILYMVSSFNFSEILQETIVRCRGLSKRAL